MEPTTGLGGLTGNNAIDSDEKLGSGQFVSNNLIFLSVFLPAFIIWKKNQIQEVAESKNITITRQ